jgi:uncharacterized protein (TIGR02246 family)
MLVGCSGQAPVAASFSTIDRAAVRAAADAYVQAWLNDDRAAVMATLDEDAVLMPAGMQPLATRAAIEHFWWPDDGSRTRVTGYTLDVDEVDGSGDLAWTRGHAAISFTYEKGETRLEQTNPTIDLTLYRRHADGSWRITRRMWTAVHP